MCVILLTDVCSNNYFFKLNRTHSLILKKTKWSHLFRSVICLVSTPAAVRAVPNSCCVGFVVLDYVITCCRHPPFDPWNKTLSPFIRERRCEGERHAEIIMTGFARGGHFNRRVSCSYSCVIFAGTGFYVLVTSAKSWSAVNNLGLKPECVWCVVFKTSTKEKENLKKKGGPFMWNVWCAVNVGTQV